MKRGNRLALRYEPFWHRGPFPDPREFSGRSSGYQKQAIAVRELMLPQKRKTQLFRQRNLHKTTVSVLIFEKQCGSGDSPLAEGCHEDRIYSSNDPLQFEQKPFGYFRAVTMFGKYRELAPCVITGHTIASAIHTQMRESYCENDVMKKSDGLRLELSLSKHTL